MKLPLPALVLLAGLASTSAFGRDLTSCDEAKTAPAIMKCAEAEFRAQEDRLSQTLRELTQHADAERQNLLKSAQRAWAAFRDAECRLAADEIRGDTEAPILAAGCLAEMTQERADQLGRLLETE